MFSSYCCPQWEQSKREKTVRNERQKAKTDGNVKDFRCNRADKQQHNHNNNNRICFVADTGCLRWISFIFPSFVLAVVLFLSLFCFHFTDLSAQLFMRVRKSCMQCKWNLLYWLMSHLSWNPSIVVALIRVYVALYYYYFSKSVYVYFYHYANIPDYLPCIQFDFGSLAYLLEFPQVRKMRVYTQHLPIFVKSIIISENISIYLPAKTLNNIV